MKRLLVLLFACAEVEEEAPPAPASKPVAAASAPVEEKPDLGALFAAATQAKDADKLEAILAIDPTYCPAYVNAGALRERARQPERAAQLYRDGSAHCGEAAAALVAFTLRHGGNAISLAEDAIRRFPASLELRHRYAEALIAAGRHAEAEKQALGVLKNDEKNVAAMLDLSRAYFAQRKLELARLAVDNARAIEPERGELYHQLGVLLLDKNERPQALAAFKKACELRPDLAASQINLSQLLGETGDYEGALQAAEAAMAYAPENTKAKLALANAYKGSQQYAEAEKAYTALGDADALYNLGIMYMDTESLPLEERMGKAIAAFSKIDKKTPEIEGYIAQCKRQLEAEKKRKTRKVK